MVVNKFYYPKTVLSPRAYLEMKFGNVFRFEGEVLQQKNFIYCCYFT